MFSKAVFEKNIQMKPKALLSILCISLFLGTPNNSANWRQSALHSRGGFLEKWWRDMAVIVTGGKCNYAWCNLHDSVTSAIFVAQLEQSKKGDGETTTRIQRAFKNSV